MAQDKESLCQYLTLNGTAFTSVEPIVDGGAVNYIWRVTTISGRSIIVKHAFHHLRRNENFLISVDRMDYEARALRTVPELISSNTDHLNVRLPGVVQYDGEQHVLQITDGGSRNLKAAYLDPTLDIKALGARLGHWLANLHTITSSSSVLPVIKEQFNNVSGKSIYRTFSNNSAASLKKFGYDPQLGERINNKFGALLETDEVCLSHGDFWPANVVVSDPDLTCSTPKLTVIDWEFTRIGNGATDVGQFAAEAWIQEKFSAGETGPRGLFEAFLEAYLDKRRLSDEDKLRVAAQFGTHLIYLPGIVPYPAGSQQPLDMMKIGHEILLMVDAGDIQSLKGGVLGLVFDK
jgi:5-methylthioribose kinase